MAPLPSSPLATHLAENARATGLLRPKDRILVAVSGGRDSTALACLLGAVAESLELTLAVGHVNHGWRGSAEADADQAAVRALCARLDIPFFGGPPPPFYLPQTEEAARRHRYRVLGEIARAKGYGSIATGHHAGDQAETLLMRLLRGSGLVGLAGIPPSRGLAPGNLRVIRPLLEVAPETLEAWLSERAIPWREDPTNTDVRRDRARIRARLAARSPQNRHDLAQLATRLRRRLTERQAWIEQHLEAALEHDPLAHTVAVPAGLLRGLRGEDLALALRHAGAFLEAARAGPWLTRRHVACVEDVLAKGGALDLPRGLRVHARGNTLWLLRRPTPALTVPNLSVRIVPAAQFDLAAWRLQGDRWTAALDADVLGSAPVLRPLAVNDTFAPLGGSGRPVLVSAWMRRQALPRFVRRAQCVVTGEAGVGWLAGRRVDHAHAVTAQTKRVALVRAALS